MQHSTAAEVFLGSPVIFEPFTRQQGSAFLDRHFRFFFILKLTFLIQFTSFPLT